MIVNYPDLIELSEDEENDLKRYLRDTLLRSARERSQYIQDLIQLQDDYWAEPKGERTTPWKGACNIIVPLTAIAYETIHSRTMMQLKGLKQITSARVINPAYDQATTALESYMDQELRHSVKFYEAIEPAIMDIELFGTGVASTNYENIVKYGMRDVNGKMEEFPVTISRGPRVTSVPISRFIFPYVSASLETAEYVGEEITKTKYEIEVLEDSGVFYKGTSEGIRLKYLSLLANLNTPGQAFSDNIERRTDQTPDPLSDRLTFVELWFGYKLKDRFIEVVAHYSPDLDVLLSFRYNWNFDLRRKYEVGRYFPLAHRIVGIGIAKQTQQFQYEVTTQSRQAIDNASLANMRMFKMSKLSGYGPNEPIFPGKIWFLDDMTQIDTVQMGELYPSAYNNQQQTILFAQQRNGVNEAVLGMPQAGTPGTATSDLQRVRESQKKFDYTYSNIKGFADKLVTGVSLQIAQFGPTADTYFTSIDGGELARQFFQQDPDLIKNNLLLELCTSGEKDNDLIERQNWMQVSQLMQAYIPGMLQLAQMTGNPQLAQIIATKGMSISTEMMRQIFETFGTKNVDKLIIRELLSLGASQAPPIGGGIAGANGIDPLGAMGAPSQASGFIGAGSS